MELSPLQVALEAMVVWGKMTRLSRSLSLLEGGQGVSTWSSFKVHTNDLRKRPNNEILLMKLDNGRVRDSHGHGRARLTHVPMDSVREADG